jgi:hypothetical protein
VTLDTQATSPTGVSTAAGATHGAAADDDKDTLFRSGVDARAQGIPAPHRQAVVRRDRRAARRRTSSHYREHGHAIARGIDPRPYGGVVGNSGTGGRGGSMHIFDTSKSFMGGYAIVAGHCR